MAENETLKRACELLVNKWVEEAEQKLEGQARAWKPSPEYLEAKAKLFDR